MSWLTILNREVIACTRCPRLVAYREQVAREKRRAYRDQEYWGKPVPGFGDPDARVLIMGLAPGAHGSNRTGRPFTGDASGNFMYPVLYETGFANQPTATKRGDGLELKNLYITAAVRCAPPDNKPLPQELAECSHFLDRELAGLEKVKVVVALGKIGFDAYLNYMKRCGLILIARVISSNTAPGTGYRMAKCCWPHTTRRIRIPKRASLRERCLWRFFKRRQELPMSESGRRRSRTVSPSPISGVLRNQGSRTGAASCVARALLPAKRLALG